MLPAVAPHARIMRYGYQSQWFGEGAMRQKASTVAQRLLLALRRKREDCSSRPLLFIAHCFGGLVVLKALLEAQQDKKEWPGMFDSTTGLVFLGTPFRGAEGMSQVEMLAAAQREYQLDEIQPEVLKILEPGNEFLQEVVDQFGKTRKQANKAQVACFYELKSSNVGRIVGKSDRTRFVVSESSDCLDVSDATSKFSLSRTHFDINKFGKPTEEDFETVRDVVRDMIRASPALVLARSEFATKHKIDFSLRGVPTVGQFVAREAEMQALVRLLVEAPSATCRHRNVVVVHGLGGIGKTQLVVRFARTHEGRFSGVFWLDGSSEANLKQSFVDMAQRLPQGELTVGGAASFSEGHVAVRECLRWLSFPSNPHWLLILDNVDRDHHDREDLQAYNAEQYFPHADHGSILITSRLASLQRLSSGVKISTVAAEQARAILENNAGRAIENADAVLKLLHGLPLALTQAGSYMRETDATATTYVKHYDRTWGRLMEEEARFPLEEYGDRSVLTTWTMSYEQLCRRSKVAPCLLKLWGFLDSGEVWYELIAAGSDLVEKMDVPAWLLELAGDELTFNAAMGLLSRYSLADGNEGTGSHSMHSVLHRWCGSLADEEEQFELGRIAVGLVATSVLIKADKEFWKKRKQLMAHGLRVSGWMEDACQSGGEGRTEAQIQPGVLYSLGYLLRDEDQQRAVQMYQRALEGYEKTWGREHTSTLDTVNNLGVLYVDLGRMEEAEQMYQRALKGYEKTWGREHAEALETVNNLGILYVDLGRMEEAEQMLQRALNGYAIAVSADNLPTNVPALRNMCALACLRKRQGRIENARYWYSQALRGYEKTYGQDHNECQALRNELTELASEEEMQEAASSRGVTHDQAFVQTPVNSSPSPTGPMSKRLRRK